MDTVPNLQTDASRETIPAKVWLVPLPVVNGEHRTFPVKGAEVADWLTRLIALAPKELLERAGPIPLHVSRTDKDDTSPICTPLDGQTPGVKEFPPKHDYCTPNATEVEVKTKQATLAVTVCRALVAVSNANLLPPGAFTHKAGAALCDAIMGSALAAVAEADSAEEQAFLTGHGTNQALDVLAALKRKVEAYDALQASHKRLLKTCEALRDIEDIADVNAAREMARVAIDQAPEATTCKETPT